MVAAWSADLVAEPALVTLWSAAVDAGDPATLQVIVRPGDELGELVADLEAVEADVELVEVDDAAAGARAISSAAAVLSGRAETHAYGVPVVGPGTDATALRRALGLPARNELVAPTAGRAPRVASDREVAALAAAADVDGLLEACTRHVAAGALDSAADLALAALDLAPQRRDVLQALGDIRGAQDRPHEAALLHRRALATPSDLQGRRIADLRALWDCPRLEGMPQLLQPAIILGPGRVTIGERVVFGWHRSPGFHTGSIYVEAGRPDSEVSIGDGTLFNNDAVIRSEGPGIAVGRDGLFGTGVQIFDSDFHHLDRALRRSGKHPTAAVVIGDDVWVGTNALVLKGVTIGDGAVVAAASVVTRDVPAGVLVAGNPARIIREL